MLRPGDIILTDDKWKLTSMLIPGSWSHAALCVAKDDDFEVAEMTHVNFTKSTFYDICSEATRVAILRCNDWDPVYAEKVIQACLQFSGVQYDVAFMPGPKALYCSELVYESDFERRLKVDTSDLAGIGIEYVSPDDLWEAGNIEVIWDSGQKAIRT